MQRTNIYLSDDQVARLDARARAEGMSRAEVVRRVLDRGLRGETDRAASDLAALAGSFGALRDDVVEVDRGDGARGAHLDRIARR
ncbi:MAG: CopG family transcriptional regulator [Dermatophilaceae bacterium]